MRRFLGVVFLLAGLVVSAAEEAKPGYHPLGGAEPSAACAQGYRALLAGDVAVAKTSFEAAVKAKPEAPAHYGLGLLHWLSGDDQLALEQFALALKNGRQDPWAEGYLLVLWGTAGICRDAKPFVETLTALGNDADAPARLRDLAAFSLGKWAIMMGQWDQARSFFARLQYLRTWQLIGPFDNRDASGMAKSYAPENAVDLEKPADGRHRQVQWFRCAAEPMDGVINLTQVFEPNTHSLAYALTHVKVAANQWAVLHAGSGGALKVWVNGREVLGIEEYNAFSAEKKTVPVYLHAGWNRILVKVAANERPDWAFAVRLSAPQGGALPGLEVSSSPESSKAYTASAEGRATPLLEPGAPDLGLLPRIETALRQDPDHPLLRCWRGWLFDVWNMGTANDEPAVAEYQKALARCPNCPLFLADLTQATKDVNLARQSAEKCKAAHPGLPLSWNTLAEISANAGLEPTAEACARDGLAAFGSVRAAECASQLAEILVRRGQLAEAERLAKAIVEVRPYQPANWDLLVRTQASRSARRAILTEAVKSCGGDRGLRQQQVTELTLQKKEGDAAALLDQALCMNAFAIAEYMEVATAWSRAGRFDKSMETLAAARKIAPENPDLLAAIGTELLRAGKREEAVALWREVLRIKPDSPQIKDWLAEADKGGAVDCSFFAAYDVRTKRLAAASGQGLSQRPFHHPTEPGSDSCQPERLGQSDGAHHRQVVPP